MPSYIDNYIENEDPTADPYVHQKDAIDWLCYRYYNHKGAILADTMGLGKTMDGCMTLAITKPKIAILICPKSVIYHWIENILSKCKTFAVFITNTVSVTHVYLDQNGYVAEGQNYPFDNLMVETPYSKIVVCNFEAVKPFPGVADRGMIKGSKIETDASLDEYIPELTPFKNVLFDMVIVDEVHRLRNGINTRLDQNEKRKKLLTFHRMMRIRMTPTGIRIGLTGTPIQNRISDMASLLKFVGAEIPIRLTDSVLKGMIKEYMFRRTGDDLHFALRSLIRYPEIDYQNHMVEVVYQTQPEADLYSMVAGKITGTEIPGQRNNPYSAVVYENNPLKRHTLEIMLSADINLFVKVHNQMYGTNLPFWNGTNSKHAMIARKVHELAKENKSIIIFLHYYAEKDNILYYLSLIQDSELGPFLGYKYYEINGEIDSKGRQFVVNDTKKRIDNGERCIIFANIQTAAEGLNLQHFDIGIFATTDYNPQSEEQAIARLHRIGQTRLVHIYRYIHACVFNSKASSKKHVDLRKEEKKNIKRSKFYEYVANCENAAHSWPIREMPGFPGEKSVQFSQGEQFEDDNGDIVFQPNDIDSLVQPLSSIAINAFYGNNIEAKYGETLERQDLALFNEPPRPGRTINESTDIKRGYPILNKEQKLALLSMPSMPDKIKNEEPKLLSNPLVNQPPSEELSEREKIRLAREKRFGPNV